MAYVGNSKDPTEIRMSNIVNNLSKKLDVGVSINILVHSILHKRPTNRVMYTLLLSDRGKVSYYDYYSWTSLLSAYRKLMAK